MSKGNDLIDSLIEVNEDQLDQWYAERGIVTERAKWKARALAAEATIATLSEALAEAEKKGAVQAAALKLTADDQFALATAIAANLGYHLTPEPPHPDAPGPGMFEAAAERAFAFSSDDTAIVTSDDYRAAHNLSQGGQHG